VCETAAQAPRQRGPGVPAEVGISEA
jgi:hypothetical protein